MGHISSMEKFEYKLFNETDQRKYLEKLIKETEEEHYQLSVLKLTGAYPTQSLVILEKKLDTYYKLRDELGPEKF